MMFLAVVGHDSPSKRVRIAKSLNLFTVTIHVLPRFSTFTPIRLLLGL